jgi:hypothetical protein
MSLVAFHKFLISTAIIFCLGFAFRQLSDFQVTGDRSTLIVAVAFGAAAIALGFYLRHLRDILRIPEPRADLRPFVKSQSDSFSHPLFLSMDAQAKAEPADVLPVGSGNGHGRSDMPPIKENGHEE